MRTRIIHALRYPRKLMQDNLDLDDCAHGGNFDPDDQGCDDCYYGLECSWLFSHDESVDLEAKSTEALRQALQYCYEYVDARVTEWGHDSKGCTCEACDWLRVTHPLLAIALE